MSEKIPAYILARSGRIRDGLAALLRAIPRIGVIRYMNGDLTEWESIPDQKQALFLLDASLINPELWDTIKQDTRQKCIVLADNVLQQQQARAAGADEVLLAGFPATQLFTVIENLFDPATIPLEETGRKNGTVATK
jgi:hypothetical protein